MTVTFDCLPLAINASLDLISPPDNSIVGIMWLIDDTSSIESPGDHFLFSSLFSSSLPSLSSSDTLFIIILLEPISFICSMIAFCAPEPIASMATTAATPKMIPNAVRKARNLLATIPSIAR